MSIYLKDFILLNDSARTNPINNNVVQTIGQLI